LGVTTPCEILNAYIDICIGVEGGDILRSDKEEVIKTLRYNKMNGAKHTFYFYQKG
jgi:hypothetical protein